VHGVRVGNVTLIHHLGLHGVRVGSVTGSHHLGMPRKLQAEKYTNPSAIKLNRTTLASHAPDALWLSLRLYYLILLMLIVVGLHSWVARILTTPAHLYNLVGWLKM